jgi:hypothetical protein
MTVTKVLIDGGAGLNIIFADTLRKIDLDFAVLLTPTDVPFYGIVPGKAAMPLGQITLPVTFRTPDNYHTEFIKFEIADFKSSYHAIFGRPALLSLWQPRITHIFCSRCQVSTVFSHSEAI